MAVLVYVPAAEYVFDHYLIDSLPYLTAHTLAVRIAPSDEAAHALLEIDRPLEREIALRLVGIADPVRDGFTVHRRIPHQGVELAVLSAGIDGGRQVLQELEVEGPSREGRVERSRVDAGSSLAAENV